MEINKNRFNKGKKYGKGLIEHSLRELGCGRSVLADKNGVIIAGNDVYDTAIGMGKKTLVIEIDGDTLVVVKRTDLDINTKKGKELALVDNLSQEKNLEWDANLLQKAMKDDLSFDPRKWGGHQCLVRELDLQDFFPEDVVRQTPVKTQQEQVFEQDRQLSLFDEFNMQENEEIC